MSGKKSILEDRIKKLELELSEYRDKFYMLEVDNKDLQSQKDYYQLISDFAHDWEFWLTPEGKFNYCSPSCLDLTGYSSEKFLSIPGLIDKLVYPEDLQRYKKFISDTLDFSIIDNSLEFRILTRSKHLLWCEVKCRAVYDNRGKYLGQRCSVSDITKLKSALGRINTLARSKDNEIKVRQKYKSELEVKERELVSTLLLVAQKNGLIGYLKSNVSMLREAVTADSRKKIDEMLGKINGANIASSDWDTFKTQFERIDPGFFERLNQKFPALSPGERRLCAFLKLNFSTKEIAGLLNLAPESTEIARVRLRKKLGMSRKMRLPDFISTI
jgi:PAS domain S-box-containing protein